jgi:hypothetical protein
MAPRLADGSGTYCSRAAVPRKACIDDPWLDHRATGLRVDAENAVEPVGAIGLRCPRPVPTLSPVPAPRATKGVLDVELPHHRNEFVREPGSDDLG